MKSFKFISSFATLFLFTGIIYFSLTGLSSDVQNSGNNTPTVAPAVAPVSEEKISENCHFDIQLINGSGCTGGYVTYCIDGGNTVAIGYTSSFRISLPCGESHTICLKYGSCYAEFDLKSSCPCTESDNLVQVTVHPGPACQCFAS